MMLSETLSGSLDPRPTITALPASSLIPRWGSITTGQGSTTHDRVDFGRWMPSKVIHKSLSRLISIYMLETTLLTAVIHQEIYLFPISSMGRLSTGKLGKISS